MIKVKVLQPFSGGGYAPRIGEVLEVPQEIAKDWLKYGLAEEIKKETATKTPVAETANKK